jgi:hypothetical protein
MGSRGVGEVLLGCGWWGDFGVNMNGARKAIRNLYMKEICMNRKLEGV